MKFRIVIAAVVFALVSVIGASQAEAQVRVTVGQQRHYNHHRRPVVRERVIVRHRRPAVRTRVIVRERPGYYNRGHRRGYDRGYHRGHYRSHRSNRY